MARVKISSSMMWERYTPDCPHCGEHMDDAALTLDQLLASWPLPSFVPAGEDGYARELEGRLVVACPHCTRPSVVAIGHGEVKLIAARTEKDLQLEEGR